MCIQAAAFSELLVLRILLCNGLGIQPSIISFLESHDYESAVRNAISLGGDADTQACIAGGIAEAYYKEIPSHIKSFCDGKIDSTIKSVVNDFCKAYHVI